MGLVPERSLSQEEEQRAAPGLRFLPLALGGA